VFPAAQIVYSTYTLGLLGPEALPEVWQKLVASLPRGGVMAVDFFGTNDSWAERPDVATLPLEEIDAMFRDFQVIDRSVRHEHGRFLADKTHWHVMTTLARKLRCARPGRGSSGARAEPSDARAECAVAPPRTRRHQRQTEHRRR